METGEIIALPEGWYLDVVTRVKFRYDENGCPVDEHGNRLGPWEE